MNQQRFKPAYRVRREQSAKSNTLASFEAKDVYDAYRDLVKHEDFLRNERLKTLFTIQGLLFGALSFAWKECNPLAFVLPMVAFGLYIAIYYYYDLANGENAMAVILKEWSKLPAAASGIPRVIGLTHRERPKAPPMRAPSWIVGGLATLWICILLATIYKTCLLSPCSRSMLVPAHSSDAAMWEESPNPSIERTSQRPLRALCAAAHVER